jgi:hypothetical protein
MTDLNRELNQHTVADFEATAARDTSTTPTRNFDDAEEQAAIKAAAAARRSK